MERGHGWLVWPLCLAAAVAASPWMLLGSDPAALGVCAVGATVLLAVGAERVLARRPFSPALTGLVVALLAHPGMAIIYTAVSVLTGRDSWRTISVVALSLVLWGWVTLPLGALAGCIAGLRAKAVTGSPAGSSDEPPAGFSDEPPAGFSDGPPAGPAAAGSS